MVVPPVMVMCVQVDQAAADGEYMRMLGSELGVDTGVAAVESRMCYIPAPTFVTETTVVIGASKGDRRSGHTSALLRGDVRGVAGVRYEVSDQCCRPCLGHHGGTNNGL